MLGIPHNSAKKDNENAEEQERGVDRYIPSNLTIDFDRRASRNEKGREA